MTFLVLRFIVLGIVTLNMNLKIALIESGKDQRAVAKLAHIHETRLSKIILNRAVPNESERLRIAGVLQRSVSELFPEVAA